MDQFDHEKLEVYRRTIEFVAWVDEHVVGLSGKSRNVRDQLIRCSQSMPLNIAEGNGKRPGPDRRRYFESDRGSALESAAAIDVLLVTKAIETPVAQAGKALLLPIVKMLIALAPPE